MQTTKMQTESYKGKKCKREKREKGKGGMSFSLSSHHVKKILKVYHHKT